MDKYTELFIGIVLGVILTLIIIFLKNRANKIKESVEIYRLPNRNFHMVINGLQYRFVEDTTYFHYSKIYSFPSGVRCIDDNNYLMNLVSGFKEQEEADIRKKEYETEMFLGLSDSYSKLDKQSVVKEIGGYD